jgi:hypothetical protein
MTRCSMTVGAPRGGVSAPIRRPQIRINASPGFSKRSVAVWGGRLIMPVQPSKGKVKSRFILPSLSSWISPCVLMVKQDRENEQMATSRAQCFPRRFERLKKSPVIRRIIFQEVWGPSASIPTTPSQGGHEVGRSSLSSLLCLSDRLESQTQFLRLRGIRAIPL